MTLLLGMRFLADHLAGDRYFGIRRPGENLDLARTQLALLADFERQRVRLAGVSEAQVAAESDRAARVKPSASRRIELIGFFVVLWAVLVAAYGLCVIGLGGRDAMTSADSPSASYPSSASTRSMRR